MIILKPYRPDKDLGRAYNEAMRLIPEGSHACLMDIDTMFLNPEQPAIISKYVDQYPDAVLTCYTNRISPLSKQLYKGVMSEETDIKAHARKAAVMQELPMSVQKITNPISGFLMVVPKKVWSSFRFMEGKGCLGVDTMFSKLLHANGVPVLLMENIYVFHYYRLMNGVKNKTHLLT